MVEGSQQRILSIWLFSTLPKTQWQLDWSTRMFIEGPFLGHSTCLFFGHVVWWSTAVWTATTTRRRRPGRSLTMGFVTSVEIFQDVICCGDGGWHESYLYFEPVWPVSTFTGPLLIDTLKLSSKISIGRMISLLILFLLSSLSLWPMQVKDCAILFSNQFRICRGIATEKLAAKLLSTLQSLILIRNWLFTEGTNDHSVVMASSYPFNSLSHRARFF